MNKMAPILTPNQVTNLSIIITMEMNSNLRNHPEHFTEGTKPFEQPKIEQEIHKYNEDPEALYEYLEDWASITNPLFDIILDLVARISNETLNN